MTEQTGKKKRSRRAGSCQAIEAGRKYMIRVFLGKDSAGRRHYHSEVFHGPAKAAETHLRQLLTRRSQGEPLKATDETVEQFFEQWLASIQRTVRERSSDHYASIVETYVKPELGKLRLVDVRASHIEALYARMAGRGLSGTTARYVHTLLRSAFKLAKKRDLIRQDPLETVKPPKADSREMNAMKPEEAKRFIDHAMQTREGAMFLFALQTGARPAEYLGLKWEDIDWREKTVTIRRSLVVNARREWRLTEPKNRTSIRALNLGDSLCAALQDHRTRQLEDRMKAGKDWRDHGFAFATENGEPYRLDTARSRFRFILRFAGLSEKFRLYDLRHTFGSLLAGAGVNIKTIAEVMGHSNIQTTLKSYIHASTEMKKDALDRMERIISG